MSQDGLVRRRGHQLGLMVYWGCSRAPLSDRLIGGQDAIHRRSTGNGLRRAASPRSRRRTVRARATSTSRICSRSASHSARAGVDGAAGARELTSDDGRRSPVTRPVLGRPAPRTCAASGWTAIDAFRVRGSIPAARQLSPCTSRIVCAVCNSAPGEPLAPRARAPSHPAGCVRPVSRRALRGQLPQRALAPEAVRCELYNPSRRSRRPTSPGCVQRSASSRIRSRYSAVTPLRLGHNLRVRGRSGAAGPGGLVATLLDPQLDRKPHSMSSSLSLRSSVFTSTDLQKFQRLLVSQ